MADKIIDPFTNIDLRQLPAADPSNDPIFLSNLQALNVGQGGGNVFRADKQGIWLGGKTFDVANFSVTMDGAMTANSFNVVGGTIRYGKTSFTDSEHSGYFASSAGIYAGSAGDATKLKFTIADGTFDLVGTISGRNSAIIANAINSYGHFIDDRLDTSSKQILGDFTFGVSGAIKMITDTNNGLWISPTGILGKKAGNTTFAIDTSGNATFAGTLSAAAGTLGTITAGTFTGISVTSSMVTAGTIQTAVKDNERIVLSALESTINMYWKDTDNKNRAWIAYDFDNSKFHIYNYDGSSSSRDYVFDANSGAFYCSHNGQNLGTDTYRWYLFAEGIVTYGHLNFNDQNISSGSLTCDKYFTVQVKGTTYKVPCVAA